VERGHIRCGLSTATCLPREVGRAGGLAFGFWTGEVAVSGAGFGAALSGGGRDWTAEIDFWSPDLARSWEVVPAILAQAVFPMQAARFYEQRVVGGGRFGGGVAAVWRRIAAVRAGLAGAAR